MEVGLSEVDIYPYAEFMRCIVIVQCGLYIWETDMEGFEIEERIGQVV